MFQIIIDFMFRAWYSVIPSLVLTEGPRRPEQGTEQQGCTGTGTHGDILPGACSLLMGTSNRWNLCIGILSFMHVGMSSGASRIQERALLASLFTNYTVYMPLCRPAQDDGIVNVTIGMAIYGLPQIDLVRPLSSLLEHLPRPTPGTSTT